MISRPILSRPALAWTLAAVQLVLMAQAFVFFALSGVWFGSEFAMIGSAGAVLVGALVVSRHANNRIGWISLLLPVPGILSWVLDEYALLSRIHHVYVPFADLAFWTADWIWCPSLGVALSVLILRFPNGDVPHGWRFVEWIAAGGMVLFAGSLALLRTPSPVPLIASMGPNQTVAHELLFAAGFGLITISAVGAAASLVVRYRRGDRQLRQQTKWIVLVFIVVTIALLYAVVVAFGFSNPRSDLALAPTYIAFDFLPVAIGVAILRYGLFDIDLIISRTLMYVTLTAILGGLYVAVIELVQRLFVLYTGERSDTAIVITAFVVAGAFTPIQKWLERLMERRFEGRDVAARLHSVSSSAESVVRVIDPHRFARWLVDESVTRFDAEGGVLYLHEHDPSYPFHRSGHLTGEPQVEIAVRHADHDLGRLLLGRRRGGVEYSHRDLEALKRTAAALGEALLVAADFGHVVAPRPGAALKPEEKSVHSARV
jgi:hypothetical protein